MGIVVEKCVDVEGFVEARMDWKNVGLHMG